MTGSPIFAFSPKGGRVECSAFSNSFKSLAILLVLMAAAWTWQLWQDGILVMSLQSSGWLLAALSMMIWTQWHIMRGKTSLDNASLQQSWIWDKRVELNNLAYAKLIHIRGLNWLIAPRLYTKTFTGKLTVFYASSPEVLAEFQRLESELKALQTFS